MSEGLYEGSLHDSPSSRHTTPQKRSVDLGGLHGATLSIPALSDRGVHCCG